MISNCLISGTVTAQLVEHKVLFDEGSDGCFGLGLGMAPSCLICFAALVLLQLCFSFCPRSPLSLLFSLPKLASNLLFCAWYDCVLLRCIIFLRYLQTHMLSTFGW